MYTPVNRRKDCKRSRRSVNLERVLHILQNSLFRSTFKWNGLMRTGRIDIFFEGYDSEIMRQISFFAFNEITKLAITYYRQKCVIKPDLRCH